MRILGCLIMTLLTSLPVWGAVLNAGLEPVGTTPEEFGVFVKTNLAHWIQLIKQTGIHAS